MFTFNNRRVLIISLVLVAIGFIFSVKATSWSVVFLSAAWLLNIKEHNFKSLFQDKRALVPVLYFVLVLLWTWFAMDKVQAQKDVIRQISFVLFPLIFLTIKPLDSQERRGIIQIYIYANLALFVVSFLVASYYQWGFYVKTGHFSWWFFYRYDFLKVFHQHPTYVSTYATLAISFLLYQGDQIFKNKYVRICMIAVLSFGMVLYGSRMVMLIFGFVVLLFTIKHIKELPRNLQIRWTLFYLSSLFFILYGIWQIPIVKERILHSVGYKYEYKYKNHADVSKGSSIKQVRLLLWQDAVDLIKERPILGYGTGSDRLVLLNKFKKEKHNEFLRKEYNSHSVYLELQLQGGIPLVLVYLLMILVLFRKSVKDKSLILFIYFILITLVGVTEFYLARIQGVVFFIFFYYFLYTDSLNTIVKERSET